MASNFLITGTLRPYWKKYMAQKYHGNVNNVVDNINNLTNFRPIFHRGYVSPPFQIILPFLGCPTFWKIFDIPLLDIYTLTYVHTYICTYVCMYVCMYVNSYNTNVVRFPYKSSTISLKKFFATISAEKLQICQTTSSVVKFIKTSKVFYMECWGKGQIH